MGNVKNNTRNNALVNDRYNAGFNADIGVNTSEPGLVFGSDMLPVGPVLPNYGSGDNGIVYGAMSYPGDGFAGGLRSAGTGSSVRISSLSGYASGKTSMVFSVWTKPGSAAQNNKNIIGWWYAADCNIRMASGLARFSVRTTSTVFVESSLAIPTNRACHLCGVYDGSNIYMFVDGVLNSTAAQSGQIATTVDPFNLYNTNNLSSSTYAYNGTIYSAKVLTGNITDPGEYAKQEFRRGMHFTNAV